MKSKKPLVSIIVVCWNSSRYIVACLQSIRDCTASLDYEIIVVDNASSDGTAELVAAHFPEARVIRAGGNLGFPRANNVGIRGAKGDYLFLLNPDTCLKSDVVGALVSFAENNPKVGATGPKIVEKDGTVSKFTIRELPSLLDFFLSEYGFRRCFPRIFPRSGQRGWDGVSPHCVSFISGAAIMIPKAVLSEVGLLDEQLPMYFEDLDMSARIRKTGRELHVVPDAVVLHLGAQSSEISPVRSQLLAMENGQAPWLYMKTYYGQRHAGIFTVIILSGNLLRLVTLAPLFLGGIFSDACAREARRQSTRSIALIKWSLSVKSRFLDRFAHVFSTG